MSQQKLTLKDWINSMGVDLVADALGVNPSTVRHWRLGLCLPRTEQMFKIKKITKGAVSYDEMIDRHHGNK